MSRPRSSYRCRDCGAPAPRWTGRCPVCGEWNSLDEEAPAPAASPAAGGAVGRRAGSAPVMMADVRADGDELLPTGIGELDRVLGGGLTGSSVTLLAGEPGIGKSTLVLQMLASLAARGVPAMLVSAEESLAQVRRRADRLGGASSDMWVSADTNLGSIRQALSALGSGVVVVDSIQTISDPQVASAPGTVTQVRWCAQQLVDEAKAGGVAVVLVGHVTKDGSIAGPRVLEHLVDTVLTFEGQRHDPLRTVRAVKHRFGAVGELGLWEMTASGLEEIPDAGARLLADRRSGAPGSVVFAGMDGRRPLMIEVQALVGPAAGPARRSASGFDGTRLAQVLAVLERRAGLPLGTSDVYVSAVGGIRLSDPGADLAVALAVASAATGLLVDDDIVVLGEVGLGGELRRVAHGEARLAEAARLGFGKAVAPPGTPAPAPLQVAEPPHLAAALDRCLTVAAARPRLRVVQPNPA